MVKTIMRKGGKRMKMTTKAMVRINARLLQCFNFSVTKKITKTVVRMMREGT